MLEICRCVIERRTKLEVTVADAQLAGRTTRRVIVTSEIRNRTLNALRYVFRVCSAVNSKRLLRRADGSYRTNASFASAPNR